VGDPDVKERLVEERVGTRPVGFPAGARRQATVMLLLVTLLWGMSFPIVKRWHQAAEASHCPDVAVLGSLTLIALRTFFALVILLVFQPRLFFRPSRREFSIGLLIGLLNWAGFTLQVVGMTRTTPALSAFFTSLGSAWVPLLGLVFFRTAVPRLMLVGLALGLAGVAVLSRLDTETGWALGLGEQLTLASSVVFAVLIILLDRLGRAVRPGHLTIGFLIATGIPAFLLAVVWARSGSGLSAWTAWTQTMLRTRSVLADLSLLTVFCTVLAFHWMTIYQPRVAATRAALIYLLEPVFGTMFSIAVGLDGLSRVLVVGGGLILGGNLLVELPAWLRERGRKPAATWSQDAHE
jgi:drug/metabolite transporter (DMT)-like permease